MYEYHGWIALRATYRNDDEMDEELLDEALQNILLRVKAEIEKIGPDNSKLDLQVCNGGHYIHLFGFRNHKEPRGKEIRELYELVANIAVGSYGLLYEHDDEAEDGSDNEFVVHVLARGKVKKKSDPFLSPFIGVVEDEYVPHDE
jgi:hypothetical protein